MRYYGEKKKGRYKSKLLWYKYTAHIMANGLFSKEYKDFVSKMHPSNMTNNDQKFCQFLIDNKETVAAHGSSVELFKQVREYLIYKA